MRKMSPSSNSGVTLNHIKVAKAIMLALAIAMLNHGKECNTLFFLIKKRKPYLIFFVQDYWAKM